MLESKKTTNSVGRSGAIRRVIRSNNFSSNAHFAEDFGVTAAACSVETSIVVDEDDAPRLPKPPTLEEALAWIADDGWTTSGRPISKNASPFDEEERPATATPAVRCNTDDRLSFLRTKREDALRGVRDHLRGMFDQQRDGDGDERVIVVPKSLRGPRRAVSDRAVPGTVSPPDNERGAAASPERRAADPCGSDQIARNATATAASGTPRAVSPDPPARLVYVARSMREERYHSDRRCHGLRTATGGSAAVSTRGAEMRGKTPCRLCCPSAPPSSSTLIATEGIASGCRFDSSQGRLIEDDDRPHGDRRAVALVPDHLSHEGNVYVAASLKGQCYHSDPTCYGLRTARGIANVPTDSAAEMGMRPCKVCRPMALLCSPIPSIEASSRDDKSSPVASNEVASTAVRLSR